MLQILGMTMTYVFWLFLLLLFFLVGGLWLLRFSGLLGFLLLVLLSWCLGVSAMYSLSVDVPQVTRCRLSLCVECAEEYDLNTNDEVTWETRSLITYVGTKNEVKAEKKEPDPCC